MLQCCAKQLQISSWACHRPSFISTGFGTHWAGLDTEEHFLNFVLFELHKLFKLPKRIFKSWLIHWSFCKLLQAFNTALVLELVSCAVTDLEQDRDPLERAVRPSKS